MSAGARPPGKAMYVAAQSDVLWLRTVQRVLHATSREQPDYVFRKLWGLVTDPRNLRLALARVARNRGRRTAGVDGLTVRKLLQQGAEDFLRQTRDELRARTYRPSPARRVLIPKSGQLGKFRPLGIPTVKDRVVQAAMKNIMEPIFEADFSPTSYGFRPRRSVHAAIAHLKVLMQPRRARRWKLPGRLPYAWAIEGDIKGCFDNIDHHGLMQRVRRRIGDTKLSRLVLAFLKSGILREGQFLRTASGTPQGGILSPLLANIALGVIEERYERWTWPRQSPTPLTDPESIKRRAFQNRANDKRRGGLVCMPIRYADDFIVLVSAPEGPKGHQVAEREKAALAQHLKSTLGLELSPSKTLVTPVTSSMRFLGHIIKVRIHRSKQRPISTVLIPRDRTQRLRVLIKGLFARRTLNKSLEDRLGWLNRILRGWGYFYRHAWGAKRVFTSVDHFVWWTILSWLRRKHSDAPMRELAKRYGWKKPNGRMLRWQDGNARRFLMSSIRVSPYRMAWMTAPHFSSTSMESPVQ